MTSAAQNRPLTPAEQAEARRLMCMSSACLTPDEDARLKAFLHRDRLRVIRAGQYGASISEAYATANAFDR